MLSRAMDEERKGQIDRYDLADLLIRMHELEERVAKQEETQDAFNRKVLASLSQLVDYVAKWKHPVSRLVVTLSVVLSTVINQLPYILSLFH